MTNEEKQLLKLEDLSARLPYRVCIAKGNIIYPLTGINVALGYVELAVSERISIEEVKPYLRPMSSMTDKEKDELRDIIYFGFPSDDYDECGHRGVEIAYVEHDDWEKIKFDFDDFCGLENWLNIHHFDYRGLIEKGLALEAPEGMYN